MSVSEQGVQITNRFFFAIDTMIQQGKIKSLRQITEMYGLNYGNTHSIKKRPDMYILKPELIARLCLDFSISPTWVLLGKGNMFDNRKSKF